MDCHIYIFYVLSIDLKKINIETTIVKSMIIIPAVSMAEVTENSRRLFFMKKEGIR